MDTNNTSNGNVKLDMKACTSHFKVSVKPRPLEGAPKDINFNRRRFSEPANLNLVHKFKLNKPKPKHHGTLKTSSSSSSVLGQVTVSPSPSSTPPMSPLSSPRSISPCSSPAMSPPSSPPRSPSPIQRVMLKPLNRRGSWTDPYPQKFFVPLEGPNSLPPSPILSASSTPASPPSLSPSSSTDNMIVTPTTNILPPFVNVMLPPPSVPPPVIEPNIAKLMDDFHNFPNVSTNTVYLQQPAFTPSPPMFSHMEP